LHDFNSIQVDLRELERKGTLHILQTGSIHFENKKSFPRLFLDEIVTKKDGKNALRHLRMVID